MVIFIKNFQKLTKTMKEIISKYAVVCSCGCLKTIQAGERCIQFTDTKEVYKIGCKKPLPKLRLEEEE